MPTSCFATRSCKKGILGALGPADDKWSNAEPSVENLYSLAIGLLNTGKPEDKLAR